MRLLLCRSRSIASPLLRFAMWSRCSHSALYDPETGYVWDSTFWHRGVRRWTFAEWAPRYSYIEHRDSGVEDIDGARKWLNEQARKRVPYDWKALGGIFFRQRNWQSPDSWFCSELTEYVRSRFGKPRFRADASRITPGHQEITL